MKSTDWYSIDIFIKISVVTFVLSKKKKSTYISAPFFTGNRTKKQTIYLDVFFSWRHRHNTHAHYVLHSHKSHKKVKILVHWM